MPFDNFEWYFGVIIVLAVVGVLLGGLLALQALGVIA